MKRSTKGAIAAAAGAVLLLGGGGTLAYWNAESSVDGGLITAGELSLTPVDEGTWTLNGNAVTDISAVRVVPGDELLYTGTWTIGATGDNLEADLTTTGPTASGDLASFVTVSSEFTVEGATVTEITDDNGGETLAATISVDFPFGAAADNASQGDTLDLSTVTVTLTQTNATP